MLDLLFHSYNLPFSLAAALLTFLLALEILFLLMGVGISEMLEGLLSLVKSYFTMPTTKKVCDLKNHNAITNSNQFELMKSHPLMTMLAFLTLFSCGGFLLQSLWKSFKGYFLHPVIAVAVTLVASIWLFKKFSFVLEKLLPNQETTAITEQDFIGKVATICQGSAKMGSPAQARLKDRFGQTHYILIEPDGEEESKTGEKLIVIRRNNAVFIGAPTDL